MWSSNPFRAVRADAFSAIAIWTLLLAFCFAGTMRIDILHRVLHSHSTSTAATHSDDNESNACHQAIYHDAKSSCGHLSHIVVTDKCQLCDLNVHSDQVVLATTPLTTPEYSTYPVQLIPSSVVLVSISQLIPRAPPLV